MPEGPIPSRTPDRGVSRNLFLEADPDDAGLARSPVDQPARRTGRRRGRGLVVLAEQHQSTRGTQGHAAGQFARSNGNFARLRAAARHAISQADASAARLVRGLAGRRYRALVTTIAVAVLLVAFSWVVLGVRDTSTTRTAANRQVARNASVLMRQEARIEALAAEVRQLEQSARQLQTPAAPSREPAARTPQTAHRPLRRHR